MDKYVCRNFCATDTKQVVSTRLRMQCGHETLKIYVFINFVTFFRIDFEKLTNVLCELVLTYKSDFTKGLEFHGIGLFLLPVVECQFEIEL